MRASVVTMVLICGLLLGGTAAADELESARVHLRKATAAYNLGRYSEAAAEYEASYETSLDPRLLFNIGQAWRLAGDRQKALTAYRSYVRSDPDGESRPLAETRIKELEEQMRNEVSKPARMEPPAPAPLPAPPPAPAAPQREPAFTPVQSASSAPVATADAVETRPFYAKWPFWVITGVLVAGAVVAGVVIASGKGDLSMPNTDFGTQRF